MSIKETRFRNVPAIALENSILSAIVIPQMGGKIASLCYRPRQFEAAAQPSGREYRPAPHFADFSAYDASGLDDAFPCVDKGTFQGMLLPDHGIIWSSRMKEEIQGERVILRAPESPLSGLYQKEIRLEENALILFYTIENPSGGATSRPARRLPFLWTFHGLLRYEDETFLLFPPGTRKLTRVFGKGPGRFAPEECSVPPEGQIPVRQLLSEEELQENRAMAKYFLPGPAPQGTCGCLYPDHHMKLSLHWDEKVLPYLGLWITAGGYRGDRNLAWEPESAFYDAPERAAQNGTLTFLEPGGKIQFLLRIVLEEI